MTHDTLFAEMLDWQSQPLCCDYLVVLFDAVEVRIREHGAVRSKRIYLGMGMLADRQHEVLGLWMERAAGTTGRHTGWRKVFKQLQDRGVEAIRIVGLDGPTGLDAAIHAVFPTAAVQPCIAALIRRSLSEVAAADVRTVIEALRPIYAATGMRGARAALKAFGTGPWGQKYPAVAEHWQAAWTQLMPFFAVRPKLRDVVVVATDTLTDLSMKVQRKIGRQRVWVTEQAVMVAVWRVLHSVQHAARQQANAKPAGPLQARAEGFGGTAPSTRTLGI